VRVTGLYFSFHHMMTIDAYVRPTRAHRSYLTSHLSLKLVLNVQLFSRIWP